jgi:hypothetical protein
MYIGLSEMYIGVSEIYIGLSEMYFGFLVCRYFCHILIKYTFFSTGFQKMSNIKNFTKLLPLEAELIHAGGRIDRQDENNIRFSRICIRA